MKSEILDYNLLYDLVQFQYDLWLFRIVSGAISVGISRFCSPARALENNVFSEEVWKWHHLTLLDSVRQFGFPDVFVTISPYEWTFPFLFHFGLSPTEIAQFDTLHIAHVLGTIGERLFHWW